MAEEMTLFTPAAAAATLPPALRAAYLAWTPAGGREARLGRITAGVAADFRAATGVAAAPEYEETPAAVPVRCVRHCEAVLWYTLAQECGAEAEPYRTGWQNAEMWLRQSYVTVRTRGDASGEFGMPRYARPGSAGGGVYGATGGGGSGGIITNPISLGEVDEDEDGKVRGGV
jgi:hypothetical protein